MSIVDRGNHITVLKFRIRFFVNVPVYVLKS